jgi:hypothetical protein
MSDNGKILPFVRSPFRATPAPMSPEYPRFARETQRPSLPLRPNLHDDDAHK